MTIFVVLQVSLVYGQMNEPPGARARVALTGLTVAEYFRDVQGQDVLLFIDNIFRFTQAGSEVSPGFCREGHIVDLIWFLGRATTHWLYLFPQSPFVFLQRQ